MRKRKMLPVSQPCERALVVSPQAGMCNRLRTLASASALAAEIGATEFLHAWTGREEAHGVPEPPHVSEIKRVSFESLCTPAQRALPQVPIPAPLSSDTRRSFDLAVLEWPPDTFWGRVQSRSDDSQFLWTASTIVVTRAAARVVREFVSARAGRPLRILVQTSLALDPDECPTARSPFYAAVGVGRAPIYRGVSFHVRMGDFARFVPDKAEAFLRALPAAVAKCARATVPSRIVFDRADSDIWERLSRAGFSERDFFAPENPFSGAIADFRALAGSDVVVAMPESSFGVEAAAAGRAKFASIEDFLQKISPERE